VQQALVAVAVDDHQVVAPGHRVPDDLVGGGGAVGHEVGVVGTEHLGLVSLRGLHRAGVVEQRAQFGHRDRQVRTYRVLAEELVQRVAHRRFEEADAAGMPGVCHEYAERSACASGLEEWRQHGWSSAARMICRARNGTVSSQVEHAVDVAQPLQGLHVPRPPAERDTGSPGARSCSVPSRAYRLGAFLPGLAPGSPQRDAPATIPSTRSTTIVFHRCSSSCWILPQTHAGDLCADLAVRDEDRKGT
jgi:hypothetical protein